LFQLLLGNLLYALIIFGGMMLIACLRPVADLRFLKSRLVSLNVIPLKLFELRITIERYWLLFIGLWLISFFGIIHLAFLLVSLFLILGFIISAYSFNEPLEVLKLEPHFLIEKLALHLLIFIALFGLPFILTYWFHPETIYFLIYSLVYFVTIISLAINFKYAKYNPLRSLNSSYNVVVFSTYLSLLPGLILAPMFLSVYYFFKAKQNLNDYLC